MRKFLHKYGKQLMAVFSILLMVTFLIQNNAPTHNDRGDAIIAHVGKTEVRHLLLR